ncbi:MAG: hypothetical protein OXN94_09230 [Chloroflexota bacterium]|nr:hypothetical protein [Chloroflexota bacterium]MDE2858016.1 hypothetical protein [Chloroflexota bacterium]MDE2949725.1 hypothetical protein [Chloroflexota bacterium]
MVVILAHGALGPFDEIIFVSIAIIFIVMMGISWARSQGLPELEDDAPESADGEHFELE